MVVFRKGSGKLSVDDAGWKAVMQLSEIINTQKCVPAVFSQKKIFLKLLINIIWLAIKTLVFLIYFEDRHEFPYALSPHVLWYETDFLFNFLRVFEYFIQESLWKSIIFKKIIETTFTLSTYTEPVDRILVDLIPSCNS